MKTQIITLESHDDLISVRDRMSWAKSRRILLVWPGYEQVSLRPVDLRILQQHARYLGAELGLVTRQGGIRRAAQGFGIPVFRSSAEAQRTAWATSSGPGPERRLERSVGAGQLRAMRDEAKPKPSAAGSSGLVRIGSFAIGVMAVLALATLFIPRATIRLRPISRQESLSLPIRASAAVTDVSISGSVPARALSVTVSGTQSTTVTSTAMVAQDRSTGVAEFKNLTQSELTIPAGTIVYSITPAAERYATASDVKLPGKINATGEAPIQAVKAGSEGNMPANAIQAVEGLLGTSVSVTNPEPTAGGTDRTALVPDSDDRARLRQQLVAALESQAGDRLRGLIGPQDMLLQNTLQAGKVQNETYDPAAGEAGKQLTAAMTIEFQAEYVKADDLRNLARGALMAAAPSGYEPAMDSLTFSLGGTPVSAPSGETQLDVVVTCKLVHTLDLGRAAAMVRGQPPSVAASLLRAQLPLEAPPEVSMSPSWWPWLPLIPFRITVTGT